MKSIKPGRGPSAMGALGSVVAGIFGVFWTITTINMGGPGILPLFGVIFVIIAIVQGIYHYKNATGKNRMSVYDITDADEEADPLNQHFTHNNQPHHNESQSISSSEPTRPIQFCPYCGHKVNDQAYNYCPKCGEKI